MIFDFDKVDDKTAIEIYPTIESFLEYLVEKIGIEPTFITQTTKGYHFAYHLKNWIFTHQKKPYVYLSAIKDNIIDIIGCDIRGSVRNYGIWRNPLLHEHYYSSCFNYELKDFNGLIVPKKSVQKQFDHSVTERQISRGLLVEGHRNYGLFLLGMKFAKNKKNLAQANIEYFLKSVNRTIDEPLDLKEIASISKSIYTKYYLKDKIYVSSGKEKREINEGIMNFEKISNLTTEEYKKEVKRRQVLAAQRTNEIVKDRTHILKKSREAHREKYFTINTNKVMKAEKELVEKNEKVTVSKISRMSKLDRKTVKKYLYFPKVDF